MFLQYDLKNRVCHLKLWSGNSPSLLMTASLWRRNYDSRGEVRGKPARVDGKPLTSSGNGHPNWCTNRVSQADRTGVNRPHVWILTYTCNLHNYLQCNSISKVNLNLEQTVSCSTMSVAFYLSDVNAKLPEYTPWKYTGKMHPALGGGACLSSPQAALAPGESPLVLNE